MRTLVFLAALTAVAACAEPQPDRSDAAVLPSEMAAPPVTLTASPVVPGGALSLELSGMNSGQLALFFVSQSGPGPGPCAPGGSPCLDVTAPLLLGSRRADALGVATLGFPIPAGIAATEGWFQAVALAGPASTTSNVEWRLVGDGDLDGLAGADDCDDTDPNVTWACCTSWLATYDLTGSVFFIDAVFDFSVVLQEPYGDALNMGPGHVVVRFPDDNGAPGEGPVSITEYALTQNMVTGVAGFASVTTELENWSGPDECGVALGDLAAGSAGWSAPGLAPYCQDGQISCTGFLCGTSGAPPEGVPQIIDNVCTSLSLNDFDFTGALDAFTSPAITVSSDADQTTTLTLVGTRTALVQDPLTPPCGCP